MGFHDHFSGHAALYASARPSYPEELFEFLSVQCAGSVLAIDCASGNGQATGSLLKYFDRVLMTDASAEQLKQYAGAGEDNEKLVRVVAVAERLPVPDQCADMLTVAQALHWFDFDSFCEELDRVLKPGAIFAAWSYGIHSISPDIDSLIGYLYEDIIGSYWTPERRMVEDGYAGYDFPFQEIQAPSFKLSKCWSIEQVLAYLNSWSAVQRYQREKGSNPVEAIEKPLTDLWGEQAQREIQWPLTLKVRRKA
ncbi:MAG: class I SAM-dependent methyltransferase [Proteobacteria bacterium]|nr:class I SAM-dependent methyltransferase [Pseudomonadota bacterium]MDA0927491.1 class I SAM-dependent methyltransferase [Pseudomonadota bacterium]